MNSNFLIFLNHDQDHDLGAEFDYLEDAFLQVLALVLINCLTS